MTHTLISRHYDLQFCCTTISPSLDDSRPYLHIKDRELFSFSKHYQAAILPPTLKLGGVCMHVCMYTSHFRQTWHRICRSHRSSYIHLLKVLMKVVIHTLVHSEAKVLIYTVKHKWVYIKLIPKNETIYESCIIVNRVTLV